MVALNYQQITTNMFFWVNQHKKLIISLKVTYGIIIAL